MLRLSPVPLRPENSTSAIASSAPTVYINSRQYPAASKPEAITVRATEAAMVAMRKLAFILGFLPSYASGFKLRRLRRKLNRCNCESA